MGQQKGPTGQDDAQHKGKMQDAQPNKPGRSGGQQGSGQTDAPCQGKWFFTSCIGHVRVLTVL
jgi:hypothetical protein